MTTIYLEQKALDALPSMVGGMVQTYVHAAPAPCRVAFAPVAVEPVVQAEPTDERAAFEVAARAKGLDCAREPEWHPLGQPEESRPYYNSRTNAAWWAWSAALAAPAPALAARQLRDLDNSLTETIKDRDCYHEWADKLAAAIAEHFGEDIGEHSNINNPWAAALDVIAEAKPSPALAAPPALLAQIMNIPVAAHVEAMDDARRLQYKQGHRDARHAAADLVSAATASVAGLVGAQPGAVQVVPREWRNALRKLAFMARTSGGTAGPDAALMSALNEAEALLSMPYLHTAATPAPQPEAPAAVQPVPAQEQGQHDAAPPMAWNSDAARDVLAERRRQIEAEGYDPDHDDKHTDCSLSRAAACYATGSMKGWPWREEDFKDSGDGQYSENHRRMLVKAGALILAEIERLDRAMRAAHLATGDAS
ncbi:MAG: hypothetical protein KA795_19080 [Burkholderiaceae bacterium]|nr:hypothetical protein [Burkholderiaceae bacterium]